MTDEKKNKSLFYPDRIGTDFFMSMVFFFTILSGSILLLCYAHIFRVSYPTMWGCIFLPSIFVVIRRLRFSFPSLIILHVAVTITFLVVMQRIMGGNNQATYNAMFIGFSIALPNILYSLVQRLRQGLRRVRSDGFIFSILLHFMLDAMLIFTGYHFRLDMVTTNSIMIITCFLIARQTDTFEENYYHNIHSSTQPVTAAKRQHYLTTGLGVSGILLSVILLKIFPVEKFKRLLTRILLFIGELIGKLLPAAGDPDNAGGLSEGTLNAEMVEEEAENPLMTKILTTIVIVTVAICITLLIYTLIREIMKRFRHVDRIPKVVEDDSIIDIIEEVPKTKKKASKRRDFGQGYEREIRKKYYARVTKAIKSGVPIKNSSSPKQIEALIKEEGDPSISELTSLYESVRYNKE